MSELLEESTTYKRVTCPHCNNTHNVEVERTPPLSTALEAKEALEVERSADGCSKSGE